VPYSIKIEGPQQKIQLKVTDVKVNTGLKPSLFDR
jgi:hypothetical protein